MRSLSAHVRPLSLPATSHFPRHATRVIQPILIFFALRGINIHPIANIVLCFSLLGSVFSNTVSISYGTATTFTTSKNDRPTTRCTTTNLNFVHICTRFSLYKQLATGVIYSGHSASISTPILPIFLIIILSKVLILPDCMYKRQPGVSEQDQPEPDAV
jgi:Mn2+/Fe2+ NRAMP family transporter